MPSVRLQVYRDAARQQAPSTVPDLSPAQLIHALVLSHPSSQRISQGQAMLLLANAFPALGRISYVTPHSRGWVKCIRYQGERAWVLISHPTFQQPAKTR